MLFWFAFQKITHFFFFLVYTKLNITQNEIKNNNKKKI